VSDIFREIDEELRRDNLLKLWSRYGRYIIAIAVFALVVAGGIVAWRDHQLSERRAQSTRYAAALTLARDGKEADAVKVFAAIADEGGGYAILASFEEAALLAKSGDREAAAAAYDDRSPCPLDRERQPVASVRHRADGPRSAQIGG